ncbi:MAG: hypothetical protein LBQ14_01300 [Treponema sp.]|jgi:ABC-type enterobactin transport system permease subunit|nr:hypothetical protein [Treponema sp.]
MRKIALLLALVVVGALVMGCTTIRPLDLGSPSVIGSKTGEAEGFLLFGYLPCMTADYGVITAAKNGGITKIGAVDQRVANYFIFAKVTTIVSGD